MTEHKEDANIQAMVLGKKGIELLRDPILNKDLAYSENEREILGLRGLLPPKFETLEEQKERVLRELSDQPNDLSKNMYLQELQNRNETLFHRLLADHLEMLMPLVYTPTIAQVCEQFGCHYRRPRGMYISINDRGNILPILHDWSCEEIKLIVVTDGGRILGLGDLGAHGMGIPIGKLTLYCAAGGIEPRFVLPMTLDVGTNNEELLEDQHYLGLRRHRATDEEYYSFMDEFMESVALRWKGCLVQFEDFETSKAFHLMERYRFRYCCFNDDIQGTGCVTLAAILASIKITGINMRDMRFVCVGAGSAGLGVLEMIHLYLMQHEKLDDKISRERFVVCDSKGALGINDGQHGNPHYQGSLNSDKFAVVNSTISDGTSLLDVISQFSPHVIIGLSGKHGVFNEEVIRAMSRATEHPLVLPMSNPTHNSECTAEQALIWSEGRAIVATGSPFPPTSLPDGRRIVTSQCNNMYIFPGVGLAAVVGEIHLITDQMFLEAAKACASCLTSEEMSEGRLFPSISRCQEVSHRITCELLKQAEADMVITKIEGYDEKTMDLEQFVAMKLHVPTYATYE